MQQQALIALVGRPNVGKSTLFNRIIGRRMAVVSDIAGTTRDRLYGDAEWIGQSFTVVDTGGIEFEGGHHTAPLSEDSERFLPAIRQQASIAIQDADIIVQVVDGLAGLTPADEEVANVLRRTKKPVLIAANKLESTKQKDNAYEFYALSLGEVFPISALHNVGIADLLDQIIEEVPQQKYDDAEDLHDDSIKVALLGRPNAGKSTLVNQFLKEERAIVSPIAGTTRDAIDSKLVWEGEDITLIDTAGIRRRGKIEPGVEKYSVLRAIKALRRADVVLLLIDATLGPTAQDMHIAGMIDDEQQAGVVVLVNKWDAVNKDAYTIYSYEEELRQSLRFMPYVPILFISAKTGQRVNRILPLALEVNEARYKRIPTGILNKWMRDAIANYPPQVKSGKRLKFYYVTQVAVTPPTFVFFVNDPKVIHFGYERYLENQLREAHSFPGTPIKLLFRARSEDRFGK